MFSGTIALGASTSFLVGFSIALVPTWAYVLTPKGIQVSKKVEWSEEEEFSVISVELLCARKISA